MLSGFVRMLKIQEDVIEVDKKTFLHMIKKYNYKWSSTTINGAN
jgi:hypothetical protein